MVHRRPGRAGRRQEVRNARRRRAGIGEQREMRPVDVCHLRAGCDGQHLVQARPRNDFIARGREIENAGPALRERIARVDAEDRAHAFRQQP